jgi:hypothetical protein
MITFAQLGKYGRLGNQLFQYAALKSLGIKNGYEVKIPNPKIMTWHGQECLLDNFNLECGYLEDGDLQKIEFIYNEQNYDVYDSTFWNSPDNINLHGFFQSTLYFNEFDTQIRKELTLKEEFIKKADEFLNKLKKDNQNKEIVSIHLRRGDLTDGTTTPTQNYYDNNGKISKDSICGSYLDKAMKYFDNDKCIFLLFTGGSRDGDDNEKDMSWLMENLNGSNFFYSMGKTTLEDFALIQRCDHNIMSHSSSFSWWAAYLNNNPKKVVIAPKDYTMTPNAWNREQFYPKNFTII